MALTPDQIKSIEQEATRLKGWADKLSFNYSPTVVKLSPSFGTDKIVLWLLKEMSAVGQKIQKDYRVLDQSFQEADSRSRKPISNEDEAAEFDNLVNIVRGAAYQLAEDLQEIAQTAREEVTSERAIESKQDATPARSGRIGTWLWKLYEKTLKVIIDAVLERSWPK